MKELVERAIAAAKRAGAQEAFATFHKARTGHVRFAASTVTTSGEAETQQLSLSVSIGARHASADTEDVSPGGVARLAESVVARAKTTPEDPEFVPLPGKQQYVAIPQAFDARTAAADPRVRAQAVRTVLDVAREAGLVAAGLYEDNSGETTILSSKGSFCTHRETSAQLSMTFRTPDGSASAWAGAASVRAGQLDPERLARRAAEKARRWTQPEALPPGRYTVVLEPAAVGELLDYVNGSLDAREADEGRSAFSGKEGQPVFAKEVTLSSDPHDAISPGTPWAEGGLRAEPQVYAEAGVLRNLRRSRYWAQKTGKKPTADGGYLRLEGGGQSLEQLVSRVERGLLVTRVWYVRMLDPQTLGVTGLTRDATFLIEGGKISRAVRNFRFNQSLVEMLAKVEALAEVERTPASNSPVPAALVHDFNMSSISEAV